MIRYPDQEVPTLQRTIWIVLLSGCSFALYFVLIRLAEPAYVVKATGKLVIFAIVPIVYQRISGVRILRSWIRSFWPDELNWRQLGSSLAGGLLLLGLVHVLAGPIARFFDISEAVQEISQRNESSIYLLIAAFIYIPLVNAYAEEAFFRGFVNLELGRAGTKRTGSIVSAFLFTGYHLALFRDWFSLPALFLILAGLFAASLYLNRLTVKDQNILRAWILHAFANFAILSLTVRFYRF